MWKIDKQGCPKQVTDDLKKNAERNLVQTNFEDVRKVLYFPI